MQARWLLSGEEKERSFIRKLYALDETSKLAATKIDYFKRNKNYLPAWNPIHAGSHKGNWARKAWQNINTYRFCTKQNSFLGIKKSYFEVLILSFDSLQVVSYWLKSLCLPLCFTQKAVKTGQSFLPFMKFVSPLPLQPFGSFAKSWIK